LTNSEKKSYNDIRHEFNFGGVIVLTDLRKEMESLKNRLAELRVSL